MMRPHSSHLVKLNTDFKRCANSRNTFMCRILLLALLLTLSAPAFAQAPVCLYQDVLSGPASGGEGGDGIYLSIYGLNFGASQGGSTVTVNGHAVAQYLYWGSDPTGERQQISVQIASGTTGTGNVVVTTSGGTCSNLPFTVRTGKMLFVGSSTDNTTPTSCASMISANSYSTPWGTTSTNVANTNGLYSTYRTPETYEQCMSAGDTLVFLNGFNYGFFDGRGFSGSMTVADITGVTASTPLTFQARPGATATLGAGETSINGISSQGNVSYAVISGMTLIGAGTSGNTAIYGWTGFRVIGNTLKCPTCEGQVGGGYESGDPSGSATANEILGNNIVHIADSYTASNKQFHCVYVYGNSWEFGWNKISQSTCYNGLQVNLDSSSGSYGFTIHDNDIADANGSGLNMATIDPANGAISIYNNVIHHVGIQRASDGGSDDPHNCIAVKGSGTGTGAGTLHIWNNTCFDTASILNLYSSGENEAGCYQFVNAQTNVTIDLQDNVCVQPAYTYTGNYNVFFSADGSNSPSISPTPGHNWFYSVTTPGSTTPASTYGTIGNPSLVNITPCTPGCVYTNYEPQSSSSLIGAGVRLGPVVSNGVSNTYLTWDFLQTVRPNPPAIGFAEYVGISAPTGLYISSGAFISSGVSLQ